MSLLDGSLLHEQMLLSLCCCSVPSHSVGVQSLAACMLSRPLTPLPIINVYGAAAANGRHVGLLLALPVQRWLLAL